jgi:hypothetical protein
VRVQLTTDTASDKRELDGRVALHDALVEAIRLITPKELCFRLGITPQYLTEAVHNLNRKGFRAEWLVTVILMAPLDAVPPILRALANLRSFEVQRRKVRTPEEELEATREVMKRVAPGLLALVDQEPGK